MKKAIVSILAVLYLCSSAGATVHLHYCMGKLVNWSWLTRTKINAKNVECKRVGVVAKKNTSL